MSTPVSQWIDNLLNNNIDEANITGWVALTVTMAVPIAVICMFFDWKNTMEDWVFSSKGFMDYGRMSKKLYYLMFVPLYVPLMMMIAMFANSLIEWTDRPEKETKQYAVFLSKLTKSSLDESDIKDLSSTSYNTDNLKSQTRDRKGEATLETQDGATYDNNTIGGKIIDSVLGFLVSLCLWIVNIIKPIIYLFTKYSCILLYILGPLAMAFSFYEHFESKFIDWLNVYLNLKFIPVTMNILSLALNNIIEATKMSANGEAAGGGLNSTLYRLLLCIFILGAYFSVGWYTGKFIGAGTAGKAVSSGLSDMKSRVGGPIGDVGGKAVSAVKRMIKR